MSLKYHGILKGYPRIRKYFGKFADYVALLRPLTLVAPFFVGFFGSLIYLASDTLGDFWFLWDKIIFISITLSLCQAVGQVVNQSVDVKIDVINKPYRAIPSGRVTPAEAMGLGWFLSLVAIGRAFTINITFGSWILILLFFALSYNVEPLRVKRYCWLNLTWMSVSRGLLPFVAIWSVFGSPLTLKPWLLGSVAFLWCLAFQNTKDVIDIKGDRKFGIRTLPVRYGLKTTKRIIQIISLTPFILLVLYVQFGLLAFPYLLLLNLAILREIILHTLQKTTGITENTVAWTLFYFGLGMVYVLSFIAELL